MRADLFEQKFKLKVWTDDTNAYPYTVLRLNSFHNTYTIRYIFITFKLTCNLSTCYFCIYLVN